METKEATGNPPQRLRASSISIDERSHGAAKEEEQQQKGGGNSFTFLCYNVNFGMAGSSSVLSAMIHSEVSYFIH